MPALEPGISEAVDFQGATDILLEPLATPRLEQFTAPAAVFRHLTPFESSCHFWLTLYATTDLSTVSADADSQRIVGQ